MSETATKRILRDGDEIPPERFADEDVFADEVQPFLVDQSERIAQQAQFTEQVPDNTFWQAEHTALAAVLTGLLIKSASDGIAQSVGLLGTVGLGVDEAVNVAAERWANKHSLKLAKGLNRTSRQMARNRIAAWLRQGGTVRQLSDSLSEIIGPRWRAEMIAQTEITRAYGEAARLVGKEVGLRRVWIVTRDEKLCPVCRPLDGTRENRNGVFPGGFVSPPVHPRCRCFVGFVVP